MSSFDYNGPINPNPGPDEASIIIYGYIPTLSFALVAAITFGILLLAQTYYAIRWKGLYRTFHILLVVGLLSETGGYAVRAWSHYRPFVVNGFVASWTMIVIAPVFFTAAIDFTLNILVSAFPGSQSILLLTPKQVLTIFIGTDIISILVQAAGAALVGISASAEYSNERDSPISYDNANNIMIAGLALQVASWTIFLAFLLVAMYRAFTYPQFNSTTARQDGMGEAKMWRRMKMMLWVILASTLLILMRACYRLAETIMGFLNGPASSEPLFAVFEYLAVFLAVACWTVFPPASFAKHDSGTRRKGRKGRMEERKASQESNAPMV